MHWQWTSRLFTASVLACYQSFTKHIFLFDVILNCPESPLPQVLACPVINGVQRKEPMVEQHENPYGVSIWKRASNHKVNIESQISAFERRFCGGGGVNGHHMKELVSGTKPPQISLLDAGCYIQLSRTFSCTLIMGIIYF